MDNCLSSPLREQFSVEVAPDGNAPLVSVVMPCLNEAETLATCIREARSAFDAAGLTGEIIIADNGSTDGSVEIARHLGARVVSIIERGYGNALRGGIAAARGRFIVMGDADASYDFGDAPRFVERLQADCDLVMGNRFRGGIDAGAMPALHRYLGNPVLSGLGRLFYGCPVGDFHCGLRGFRKEAYDQLGLATTGMEFASEMVIKATLHRLRVAEIPTRLRPDGRSRPPHLRSWRDGWRHLRFMLLLSPRWLFFYPGLLLLGLGSIALLVLWWGPVRWGRATFDVHTMLVAGTAMLVGVQTIFAGVFARGLAARLGLYPPHPQLERWSQRVTLERGVLSGLALMIAGATGLLFATAAWRNVAYGPLDASTSMRVVIPSVVTAMIGVQTIIGSFFLSLLGFVTESRR